MNAFNLDKAKSLPAGNEVELPFARAIHLYFLGTMTTLLAAMGTFGVQRLIGCSTWGIALGCDQNLINGDEETPLPERQIHAEYTLTKHASEQLVLEANCEYYPLTVPNNKF